MIQAARQLAKFISGSVFRQHLEVSLTPLFDSERKVLKTLGESSCRKKAEDGADERGEDRRGKSEDQGKDQSLEQQRGLTQVRGFCHHGPLYPAICSH